MDNIKKAAAEASSFFNRAKQVRIDAESRQLFTEEKLGGAEKTVYEANLEVLIRRSDVSKALTERIISSTTSVLQPNPNERLEDFVLTKLDRKMPKPNNLEILGHCFVDSGNEIGTNYHYGNILIKVGEAEKKIGQTEKDFVQKSSDCFLQPLKSFLEGQMKTIQKEKKTLEIKRLDLDACKTRLKKLTDATPVKLDAEDDLRRAQTEFDRQSELTKLLMDELSVSYNHHVQCLTDFVDAQLNYYNSCSKILQDLSRQIGGAGISTAGRNLPPIPNSANIATNANTSSNGTNGTLSSNINSIAMAPLPSFSNKKKAKVLFDYEATDPSEITVSANQIISVQIVPNDNDWVLAETGRDSGKVPKAYIQIVE